MHPVVDAAAGPGDNPGLPAATDGQPPGSSHPIPDLATSMRFEGVQVN
jgi:hypothetical protein